MFDVLWTILVATTVRAVTVGGFDDGGNTLVSAMMMFLGNEDSVYILDKAEANAAHINGHSAWGSLWDVTTRKAVVMDVRSNTFCASGMHLPNGSYVTFGGNDAVTTDGERGSQKGNDGLGAWDSLYQDFDGRKAIRIVHPCKITDNLNSANCEWYDDPTVLSMVKQRWYSGAEATGDGRVVIIGGMIRGGYINRDLPNIDPAYERGQAEPTYEYFPPQAGDPQIVNFIVRTSGLNVYPHSFLMPSGRILLQANLSTTLWNHVNNTEYDLPDMPNGVVRVYPASGATAMLPLTPANNWTPTMLFCGGSTIADQDWGSYSGLNIDTWNVVASQDCQRLTPEPFDGSQPAYEQDDDMIEPRTMGQFIVLPTGKLLLINGGQNGTAGYSSNKDTPYNLSLAAAPVYTPVIYDPKAPKGSRWSNQGLSPSKFPRLYHSTAILLPDASVLVAGSNPNKDVNLSVIFPTQYEADVFYPPYLSASIRPSPQNLPQTLSYGGSSFDILIPSSSYNGSGNDAADATIVTLVRSGFTTHAMNMGQRFMQLNNTYTVSKNGSITLHVAQLPPNPNIFQPGPALLFVCINGIPSTGKLVIIGNGKIGTQPTASPSKLPASLRLDNSGTTTSSSDSSPSGSAKSTNVPLIGGIVGAIALLALTGVAAGIYIRRRRKLHEKPIYSSEGIYASIFTAAPGIRGLRDSTVTDSTALAPLTSGSFRGYNDAWDTSTGNFLTPPDVPYKDDDKSSAGGRSRPYSDYSPYVATPQQLADSMTNVNIGGDGAGLGYLPYNPAQRVISYEDLPIPEGVTDRPSTT